MAICSGAAVLALKEECTVGGGADGRHSPTCSELARTPALPGHDLRAPPRRAVRGVCPWPGRSHGAPARGGTPRAPCSPLPPHVAGAGAQEEFWLQDLLAAVAGDLDPNIQTLEAAGPPRRPPRPPLSPAGARSARGLARS